MRIEARAGRIAHVGILAAIAASDVPAEQWETTAVYLLVTFCNVPGAIAAEVLDCSRQNISQVLRRVEDRREDPQFDTALLRLEARFMAQFSEEV